MRSLILSCLFLMTSLAHAQQSYDPANAFLHMELVGFFTGQSRNQPKRLNLYVNGHDGELRAAVGTATYQGRAQWNTALMSVDLTELKAEGLRVKGRVLVSLAADPWVPKDQIIRRVWVDIDATIDPTPSPNALGSIQGTWAYAIPDEAPETLAEAGLHAKSGGEIHGGVARGGKPDISEQTYNIQLYNFVPGEAQEASLRRRGLSLGIEDGALVSAFFGATNNRGAMIAQTPLDLSSANAAVVTPDAFEISLPYTAQSVLGQDIAGVMSLKGARVGGWVVGHWQTAYTLDGQAAQDQGMFRGDVAKGVRRISEEAIQARQEQAELPWSQPMAGFQAPAPGEHPRLLFRKADLPALRAKAATPVGQAMVARLRFLLGGGEEMPTVFNPNASLNIGPKGPGSLPPGAFTVSHPAGFGMLWQLTGDAKYADLALQCLDKVFADQTDRDERYAWKTPGTGFRLSGVHQAVAIAYDLCYDAWPEETRLRVAREMQDNAPETGKPLTLEHLAIGGGYTTDSNHFGAYLAGAGLTALALRGDPGVDTERMDKVIALASQSLRLGLTAGYGDGGWFAEGAGGDKTFMLPGVVGFLQALRVARGEDWTGVERPNARMAILTRLLELMPTADSVTRPNRGAYAYGTDFWRSKRNAFANRGAGWSDDGLFAIGMGALPENLRPGMAWIYENFVEPDTAPEARIYEARIQPLHAVYALVNWPVAPRNPGELFPLAVLDSIHGYVLCRNRFQDSRDILFTGLSRTGPTGYLKPLPPQKIEVWGLGRRVSLGNLSGAIRNWRPGKDGSATFTAGETGWAVDYSRASGADAVFVSTAAAANSEQQAIQAGDRTWHVFILSQGETPKTDTEGESLVLGQQRYTWDGQTIGMAVFANP